MLIWGIVLFVAGAVALLESWVGFGPAMEQYSGYLYAFVFTCGSLGILTQLHYKRWEQAELNSILSGESPNFVVKANHKITPKRALFILGFGLFWLGLAIIFVIAFWGSTFMGTVARLGNLESIAIPALIIGMTGYGIYSLFSKGTWFIGTPKRLIIYQRNKIRFIDWEQFSGDIKVSGTFKKGDITLRMKTGRMVNRKRGSDRHVPDAICISGIQDVFSIEQACRRRIRGNDPPPIINQ